MAQSTGQPALGLLTQTLFRRTFGKKQQTPKNMNTMKDMTNDELLNTFGGDDLPLPTTPPSGGTPDLSMLPKAPYVSVYAAPGVDPALGIYVAM
jgi:hypothetical protein